MNVEWTPMRWPGSWKSPSAVGLLKGTPINWLLVDRIADLAPVVEQGTQAGLHVAEIAAPPAGAALLKGEWTRVAMTRGGGTSAGPTGVPWVDTNSYKIRLEAARRPDAEIWVDAPPKGARIFAGSYRTAIADAAAYGGRWVISLDAPLAAGIADAKADALATWKEIAAAAGFFAPPRPWCALGIPPWSPTGTRHRGCKGGCPGNLEGNCGSRRLLRRAPPVARLSPRSRRRRSEERRVGEEGRSRGAPYH